MSPTVCPTSVSCKIESASGDHVYSDGGQMELHLCISRSLQVRVRHRRVFTRPSIDQPTMFDVDRLIDLELRVESVGDEVKRPASDCLRGHPPLASRVSRLHHLDYLDFTATASLLAICVCDTDCCLRRHDAIVEVSHVYQAVTANEFPAKRLAHETANDDPLLRARGE